MTDNIRQRHLVKEYLEKTRSLCAFSLYPDISQRKAFEALPCDLRTKLIADGERAKGQPWSNILLSDYLEFSKNGNRSRFEDLYFSRRRKLCSLVMAECVENEGRFLEDILDGVYLILEESSWCLPAHNTHVRDAKQQEMPDVLHPIIDLFDAETGALIAFTEYLLRTVFKKKSPQISELINRVLEERIFTPYNTEHFWWMGDGEQPMCNWTPWCTQNVLLCVLTRPEGFFEEKEIRAYLESAAKSLDFFLDEYGDDGCCNEGAQYYSHAGLCLFGALYIMNSVLPDGEFGAVFTQELIRNIAAYIVRMNVEGNVYVNFADCAAVCPRRTSREFLFGKMCEDQVLSSFAAADFRSGTDEDKLLGEEINLFYHVMQAFSYKEMEGYPQCESLCEDSFFESTGLMVARDETYILAAKAGCNADSHNHNDVGSFTVYKNGRPMIIDLGVGTYTRETFSDKRYEIWTMQSQFHNVPTFLKEDVEGLGADPAKDLYDERVVMQNDGGEYCARAVSCELDGKDFARLSMDSAPAYDDGAVIRYARSIALLKGMGIEVTDEFEGSGRALLTLMTYDKPCVADEALGKELVIKIGDLGEVRVSGSDGCEIQTYPIEDERLSVSWKHEVYRVLIRMDEGHKLKMFID